MRNKKKKKKRRFSLLFYSSPVALYLVGWAGKASWEACLQEQSDVCNSTSLAYVTAWAVLTTASLWPALQDVHIWFPERVNSRCRLSWQLSVWSCSPSNIPTFLPHRVISSCLWSPSSPHPCPVEEHSSHGRVKSLHFCNALSLASFLPSFSPSEHLLSLVCFSSTFVSLWYKINRLKGRRPWAIHTVLNLSCFRIYQKKMPKFIRTPELIVGCANWWVQHVIFKHYLEGCIFPMQQKYSCCCRKCSTLCCSLLTHLQPWGAWELELHCKVHCCFAGILSWTCCSWMRIILEPGNNFWR